MRNGEKRMIEAATLQIVSAAKDGIVLVAMGGPNNVKVFATSGAAQVRTAAGFLVASLSPGTGLAFSPQAGAATSMQMKGVLESTDGKFFLTDVTSKTRVELRGTDLAKFKGKSIQVTGSVIMGAAAGAGASQVVQVTKMEQLNAQDAKAAGLPVGAAVAGAGAAGAGAAAAGATVLGIGVAPAVVIGAAAAAGITVGSMAAAGVGPFSSSSTP
jgi:hypothetical protein